MSIAYKDVFYMSDTKESVESLVVEVVSRRKSKQNPASSKIKGMNEEKEPTKPDSIPQEESKPLPEDVYGQMYIWDISEEPNVVIRQSQLEEFIYSVLSNPNGVSESVYLSIMSYFKYHVSKRFNTEVSNQMFKNESDLLFYLVDLPKYDPNCPAAQPLE